MTEKVVTILKAHRGQVLYLGAGGISFVVDAGSFAILHHVQPSLFLATLISFCLGLTSSSLHNRYVVFRAHSQNTQHSSRRQFVMFVGLTCFNFVFSYFVIRLAEKYLGIAVLGKVISMFFIVVWNFALFQKVIFRVEHIEIK